MFVLDCPCQLNCIIAGCTTEPDCQIVKQPSQMVQNCQSQAFDSASFDVCTWVGGGLYINRLPLFLILIMGSILVKVVDIHCTTSMINFDDNHLMLMIIQVISWTAISHKQPRPKQTGDHRSLMIIEPADCSQEEARAPPRAAQQAVGPQARGQDSVQASSRALE